LSFSPFGSHLISHLSTVHSFVLEMDLLVSNLSLILEINDWMSNNNLHVSLVSTGLVIVINVWKSSQNMYNKLL
jgi:hypothetical protein